PLPIYFSSWISTRMVSGPIFRIHPNGITYSQSVPKKPQIFPGPGITIASTSPVQTLISTSTTQPSLLPLQILITSFSRSSQIRIFPLPPQLQDLFGTAEHLSEPMCRIIRQTSDYYNIWNLSDTVTLSHTLLNIFPFPFLPRCTTIGISASALT